MIREWTSFTSRPLARGRAVFLADHDMLMTRNLVQGVDVWINTPRRPWEACGTSGMKVLVNGGINLSELDGWWAEAYGPDLGWALGDGREHGDDPSWDASEAKALYALLERQVIPDFYSRDSDGIPRAWVARMRESMARLTPYYSSNRAVRQYVEEYYLPAARAYRERQADSCRAGTGIVDWKRQLDRKWRNLRFGDITTETGPDGHSFKVQIYLEDIDPDFVSVQLYAEGEDGSDPFRQEMVRGQPRGGAINGYISPGRAPADRPVTDYTARIVPRFAGVAVPLEAPYILWQR